MWYSALILGVLYAYYWLDTPKWWRCYKPKPAREVNKGGDTLWMN